MKKILFLTAAVVFIIYFISCKDDTVTGGGNGNEAPTISGKIENWNLGSGKKIIAVAYNYDTITNEVGLDTGLIDNAGNFMLKLNTPPDSLLTLFEMGPMCTHHTLANPADLRSCGSRFTVEDSNNNTVGTVYRCTDSTPINYSGKTYAYLDYFNSSGSITGTDTCIGAIMDIVTRNTTESKGWNSSYLIFDSVASNLEKVRITTQPQVVQWYLIRYHGGATADKFYQRNYLMKGK